MGKRSKGECRCRLRQQAASMKNRCHDSGENLASIRFSPRITIRSNVDGSVLGNLWGKELREAGFVFVSTTLFIGCTRSPQMVSWTGCASAIAAAVRGSSPAASTDASSETIVKNITEIRQSSRRTEQSTCVITASNKKKSTCRRGVTITDPVRRAQQVIAASGRGIGSSREERWPSMDDGESRNRAKRHLVLATHGRRRRASFFLVCAEAEAASRAVADIFASGALDYEGNSALHGRQTRATNYNKTLEQLSRC